MHTPIIAVVVLALAGCSTSGDYRDYLTAQHAANEIAAKEQKPLFRLTAQDGQPITGLASIEVYMPTAPVQIQQSRPNEFVALGQSALGVVSTGLGLKLGGDAAIGLAGAVGKAANHGYQFINATPVITPGNTIVRPEIVQPPPAQIIQVPTQVIEQPTVVTVPSGV